MIGKTLGPYEIEALLGQGGMGQVYRARQSSLGRIVAVKVLLPHLAQNPEFVQRFMREARSTARLRHAGIVTVHDVGEQDGAYYFAMEFLEGKTLEDLIRQEGPFDAARAIGVLQQIAHALAHAHSQGVLHRDVKPSNVLVDRGHRAVLTDFGIAWAVTDTRLTLDGTTIGSPDYMSPEQVRGDALDQRADLYSLGVIFYQMLTGEVPYSGTSAVSIAFQHVNEPVRSPRARNAAVPPDVDAIAVRLMAKQPKDRYQSAGDLLRHLDGGAAVAATAPAPPRVTSSIAPAPNRRRAMMLAGALALVATVVGVVAYLQSQPARRAAGGGGGGPAFTSPPADTAANASPATPPEVTTPPVAAANTTPPSPAPPVSPPVPPVAAAPAIETFRVISQPAGARVTLDGTPLAQPTPVAVELSRDGTHELTVTLAGHETARRRIQLQDLSERQRKARELQFALVAVAPPGRLVVDSEYAARIRVNGRVIDAQKGTEVSLPAGTYDVAIEARAVFYSDTRKVVVTSDTEVPLVLPPAAPVTVGATPSNCRVFVDGVDVGYVPVTLRLAVGPHQFRFDWERLGRRLEETRIIRLDTGRIFVAAPARE